MPKEINGTNEEDRNLWWSEFGKDSSSGLFHEVVQKAYDLTDMGNNKYDAVFVLGDLSKHKSAMDPKKE